jgi:hypothetical protein
MKLTNFVNYVLLINGIIDIIVGITLIFLPAQMASLLNFPAYTDQLLYISGGWGIAALSFGIARIWASRDDTYMWYNVYLGLFEGTILAVFCILCPVIYDVTFLQVSLSLAVGASFTLLYGSSLFIKYRNKEKSDK